MDINAELNVYQIIEYCYNRRAIGEPDVFFFLFLYFFIRTSYENKIKCCSRNKPYIHTEMLLTDLCSLHYENSLENLLKDQSVFYSWSEFVNS